MNADLKELKELCKQYPVVGSYVADKVNNLDEGESVTDPVEKKMIYLLDSILLCMCD